MPTYCLGLGGSNHDYSACITVDGEVVVAIEEERIARKKYSLGVSSLSLQSRQRCLDTVGIGLDDVDAIVVDDTLLPGAYFALRRRVTTVRHHLAHAASAFFPSPFADAAILVIDGAGSLISEANAVETLTYAIGSGAEITEIGKVLGDNWVSDGLSARRIYQAGDSDHSLGFMYKAASRAIGFTILEKDDFYVTEDGKTMGLAPYGTDRLYPAMREYLELLPDGQIRVHLRDGGLLEFLDKTTADCSDDERFGVGADIAWAVQAMLEEAMVHAARHLHEVTGSTALCLSGGVALNCVANGKVLRETAFTDLFVQPAAGDAGNAIGCALFAHHVVLGQAREVVG